MPRLIKRYGSRKLYDPDQSSYVSLPEITGWILDGEEVRVVDNKTGEDVTVQVLTQVISEQGRRGSSFPTSLLHDLIRAGEEALEVGEAAIATRVRRIQETAGHMADSVHKQVDRLRQPPAIEHQMAALQERLDALERQLESIQRPAE
jgi:polyhydroxyalkanoate synthesis repressor PhaR